MFASARRLPLLPRLPPAARQTTVRARLTRPRQTAAVSTQHQPYSRPHAKRAAVTLEPLTFGLAFVAAATLAFGIDKYARNDASSPLPQDHQLQEPLDAPAHTSSSSSISPQEAQAYYLVMAANAGPGRPGNLTTEQETKLKEMWSQCLDLFGVTSNSPTPSPAKTNGSTTPAPAADKKPKKRGLFGSKKGTSDDSAGEANGNDKHGQAKEFQDAIASQSPEQLREAFWSMSKLDNPDAVLLRFLRARKWDVSAALVMLISAMHWRSNTMHVDDEIMLGGEGAAFRDAREASAGTERKKDAEGFVAQLHMGKSFLHGTDKEGRPLCFVRVKLHKGGEQSERSLEQFTVYLIETTRLMLRPPIDTATIVFDMTDFSLANMDYTPVKFMIKCFEANYPESLGSVLVYKAPWVFQGIWKIIKGWLDPVVAQKVTFASNEQELEACVSRDKIPREMGGDEQWNYEYVEPREGENDKMKDSAGKGKVLDERRQLVKSYESETVEWLSGDGKGEGRTRLAQRLAENYWRLDSYVRARSLYDRIGVIGEGGKMDFYPKGGMVNGSGKDDLD